MAISEAVKRLDTEAAVEIMAVLAAIFLRADLREDC
jgi:hypothetical protein